MDAEDRRRSFIVGSVILEIVQPLFRARLENDYRSKGQGSLQAFLNTLPVIHILFHLRHRNAYCCKDKINCRNNSKLPLIYCQWDMLYTENTGQPGHNCHCKFIANPVRLKELDITLASLILLNCCHLGPDDENAVRKLRRYKNDYLSHNIEGKINETEYKSLWTDLTNFVLQLNPNKQDELNRIEKRPLDEGLCSRYCTDLLNIHKKLNEMDTQIQGISSGIQTIGPQIQRMTSDMQELLSYHRKEAICQYCKKMLIEQGMDEIKISPYKLGQDIFYLHNQIDMNSVLRKNSVFKITDVEMMDDGRLVMCIFPVCILYICNTDGSQAIIIPVKDPFRLTSVNNSTLAVTVGLPLGNQHIEIYDINNKKKLKSIPIPGDVGYYCDITMINDKLIVSTERKLVMADYQAGEIVQSVGIHCQPGGIHSSGDRIFYRDKNQRKNALHWYSFTDEDIHTLTLPSIPWTMTTLQDGSLYVLCKDGSVQHVSSDGKQFKTLKTNQSQGISDCHKIRYNSKQKKMVTLNMKAGIVKILHEV